MSWTVDVISKGQLSSRYWREVRFSQAGLPSVTRMYTTDGTAANLRTQVNATIAELDGLVESDVALGPFALTAPLPPGPPPPPPPPPPDPPTPPPTPPPSTSLGTPHLGIGRATYSAVIPAGLATTSLRLGALSTQVDVLARHADNSIKHALLTAAVTVADYYEITAIAEVSPTPFTSVWPAVRVDIGSYVAVLPGVTETDLRLSGSLMRESRVIIVPVQGSTPHPYLRVVIDVRAFLNGSSRVDVVVENCLHAAGDTQIYDAKVTIDGAEVFSITNFRHSYKTRHRLGVFPARGFVESFITQDFAPFVAAKALPDYQPTVFNTLTDQWLIDRAPLGALGARGIGLSTNSMQDAGGRAEIAPYIDWVAQYIVHKTPNGRAAVTGTDDRAGSWPIHVLDDQHRIIRTDRQEMRYWFDNRGAFKPQGTDDLSNPLQPDRAHCPSLGYVSYLLTGDRYYLDEMKLWANFLYLKGWPDDWWYPRDERPTSALAPGVWVTTPQGRGPIETVGATTITLRLPRGGGPLVTVNISDISDLHSLFLDGEVRGVAWTLRSMSDCAAYLPDADEDKAYFIEIVRKNLLRLDREAAVDAIASGPNPFNALWAGKAATATLGGGVGHQAFQSYFTLWAIKHARDHGLWTTHGLACAQQICSWLMALYGHAQKGWLLNTSVLIYGDFAGTEPDQTVTWFADLDEVYTQSMARYDSRRTPWYGYHGMTIWVATVVAEQLGTSGAIAALTYALARDADTDGLQTYLNERAGWAIKAPAEVYPPADPSAYASDTFDGTGALSGSWTIDAGAASRVSDKCQGSGGGTNLVRWTGTAVAADQTAQADVHGGTSAGVFVRGDATKRYLLAFNGVSDGIYTHENDTYTLLQSLPPLTLTTHTIKFTVVGTTLKVFVNGRQVGTDQPAGSFAATGAPGVWSYGGSATIDNFKVFVP